MYKEFPLSSQCALFVDTDLLTYAQFELTKSDTPWNNPIWNKKQV